MDFKGKKVIVTGANRSIGQRIAIAFAEKGAHIAISYRSDEKGAEKTVKAVQELGCSAEAFYADFSHMSEVKKFADQALRFLGGVDILVNNAGMLCRENLFELGPDKMKQVFQVNSISPLYLTQLCTEHMIKMDKKGVVINISSISGTVTTHKGIGYSASKAALNKWTKCAALNLSQYGIRVNAIAPGVIESGMNENTSETDPELWKFYLSGIPLGRTGCTDDIAHMALFLASDKAEWITGKVFEVDGGNVL